jgi:4-amino-4-deoxy-L-arabinose transferase-like glycosyltransferase
MSSRVNARPRSTVVFLLVAWAALYASFTLWRPALLDDADSVHAEVAREMLLRHDYVTLYANGIRYLEKAPLLYWSMAAAMKAVGGPLHASADAMAAAARVPLALSVLALAWLCEVFARRLFGSARAGLYAGLILLSSPGFFLFSRITLPDVMVCLWLALAMLAWWRWSEGDAPRGWSAVFGLACALGVLSKGLIGLVFPLLIVAVHALWTRRRVRARDVAIAAVVFLLVAAPWHVLAGLANPTVGQPEPFRFVHGHWQVPLPSDGNVRGWFWFYFMNEHVLRYLNLRVPRDYDTSPLWLFWGLCFVWVMPWSAFAFKAARFAWLRVEDAAEERGRRLLLVWACVVLLFFSLSTRQEYYVLPALPAGAMLIAGWLVNHARTKPDAERHRIAQRRCVKVLAVFGLVFAIAAAYFLIHTQRPAPGTDLAQLLAQNPGDYALSMGHFLDLNATALGLFRLPLVIAAVSLLGGPVVALILQKGPDSAHPVRLFISVVTAKRFPGFYRFWAGRKRRMHAGVLALAAGAFGFLAAAHLGLQTFAPVLSSAQLAKQIAPLVGADDLVAIHGEYEAGSTLGFYLKRNDVHILEGRSSNLWYGSFFPDAPKIFETPATIAAKWSGQQRIFLWQSLTDPPNQLPQLNGPVYVIAKGGGKEIVSNRP